MSLIRDPQERRIRALKMLEFRITNAASLKEIAEKFNVTPKTVSKNLTWARRAGHIADAEDKILQDLIPLAHDAIKTALSKGDAAVALEIFKGVLPGFGKKPATVTATGGDDLDTYLTQLRAAHAIDAGDAIDGEIAEGSPQRALPAAAESLAAQGNDESAGGESVCVEPAAGSAPPVGVGSE